MVDACGVYFRQQQFIGQEDNSGYTCNPLLIEQDMYHLAGAILGSTVTSASCYASVDSKNVPVKKTQHAG